METAGVITIVTEANEKVATGHLIECVECAKECIRAGYEVSFWINDDMEACLKEKIPCTYQEYHLSIEEDDKVFLKELQKIEPMAILFNLREIDGAFLEKINHNKPENTKTICIDEFGHRALIADVIINPMIDEFYWDYKESSAALYCGAEYLVLPEELEELHNREKIISEKIKKIVITMGGVDPKNYTAELAEIIPCIFPDADVCIVLGGGNRHQEEIEKAVSEKDKVSVKKNISDLPELIYEADIICCAGGNTLHEAACIGTPAVVLPSMPHEKRTAEYFEKQGYAMVADIDGDWKSNIAGLLRQISQEEERRKRSRRGKAITDGLGGKRVVEIIRGIKCH